MIAKITKNVEYRVWNPLDFRKVVRISGIPDFFHFWPDDFEKKKNLSEYFLYIS